MLHRSIRMPCGKWFRIAETPKMKNRPQPWARQIGKENCRVCLTMGRAIVWIIASVKMVSECERAVCHVWPHPWSRSLEKRPAGPNLFMDGRAAVLVRPALFHYSVIFALSESCPTFTVVLVLFVPARVLPKS